MECPVSLKYLVMTLRQLKEGHENHFRKRAGIDGHMAGHPLTTLMHSYKKLINKKLFKQELL